MLEGNDTLYERLLLKTEEKDEFDAKDTRKPASSYHTIIPQPGFCLKTTNSNGVKIFINICRAQNVPAPKDISDEELMKLVESEDPGNYRIPMSLGEPHAEIDNSGIGCTAYDVIINSQFYEVVQKREILLGFLLTLVLEGLEYKYDMSLNRDWKILKNRKLVGSLVEQHVRAQEKPLIVDVDSAESNLIQPIAKNALISEVASTSTARESSSKIPAPLYKILQEPPNGKAEFLVAEIQLPKLKSVASITLDVGEDRIFLQTRSNTYLLDIYLPYDIDQEEVGAQFNCVTKILTITMPVADKG